MTAGAHPPVAPAGLPLRPARGTRSLGLVVAVAAAGALVVIGPAASPAPPPPGRVDVATAWPRVVRADFDPVMPDGPLFNPVLFLDATTAIGTAPTPDARWVRLLLRAGGGSPRELRRLPLGENPQVEAVTAVGDDVVWTESTASRPQVGIWHARLSGGPARLLTADTGNAVFYGNQYDLVIAEGRVHWAAASAIVKKATEVRSVSLAGGAVAVRTEDGEWAMSAWPWLYDEQEGRLRNTANGHGRRVVTSGPELATCSPVWCRVMVMSADGLARIDLMHPDGSARRRIAGAAAQAAVADVGVLDRFEVLGEPGPDADVTGTAGLLVYDVATRRTVDVAAGVDGAFAGGGMLWWSTTAPDDTITWHTLDLRTA